MLMMLRMWRKESGIRQRPMKRPMNRFAVSQFGPLQQEWWQMVHWKKKTQKLLVMILIQGFHSMQKHAAYHLSTHGFH